MRLKAAERRPSFICRYAGYTASIPVHLRHNSIDIYLRGSGMPIKDGKRYCVNHPKVRMNRTESFKALMNVKGGATDGAISSTAGLVIMTFVCEECGYLELYVADRTQHE